MLKTVYFIKSSSDVMGYPGSTRLVVYVSSMNVDRLMLEMILDCICWKYKILLRDVLIKQKAFFFADFWTFLFVFFTAII